ncbi:DUF6934 family protein [Dyadobacter fanqingshengii]|uniref:Uncharacterized protein n=1 Tax=Dyadobacter fanqingshengii TaxID=2906443 RepID=A0A9X1PB06_9BACT|nr:hypothetical protein [Dyadobacter fanqingshengii]MCF0039972.1 hypothetical protein [Dyadobacter fanqingshengii]USJ38274.1 hypothetical protein NFI81_10905 [Dyadobacter fanqingshengii]
MKAEKYHVKQLGAHIYQFYSNGVRGNFEMIIMYSPHGNNTFNLGFGVWDEALQNVDDSIELRNGDTDKILATVAQTTLNFLDENPTNSVYARGSSASRTRKYQMGISNFLSYLEINYTIQGFVATKNLDNTLIGTFPNWYGEWQRFRSGVNYDAFLLSLK